MATRLRIEGGGNRFQLHGELDHFEVERLREAFVNVNGQDAEVDLSGVTFIDSSGLRCLMEQRQEHPGLRYANPSDTVLRLLEIVGIREVVLGG